MFDNLKKRYSKRRQAVLKASKSGSGKSDVVIVQDQLKDYEFLAWINPFIKTRRSKSNFEIMEVSTSANVDDAEEEDDDSDINEREKSNDEDSLFDSSTSISQSKLEKRKAAEVKARPAAKVRKTTNNENKKEELMSTMSRLMQQRLEKNASSKNEEEERFGGMVAGELTKLPELLRVQAKHEINEVLFKYHMQSYRQKSYFIPQHNLSSCQSFSPNSSYTPRNQETVLSPLSSPNTSEKSKIDMWLSTLKNQDN